MNLNASMLRICGAVARALRTFYLEAEPELFMLPRSWSRSMSRERFHGSAYLNGGIRAELGQSLDGTEFGALAPTGPRGTLCAGGAHRVRRPRPGRNIPEFIPLRIARVRLG